MGVTHYDFRSNSWNSNSGSGSAPGYSSSSGEIVFESEVNWVSFEVDFYQSSLNLTAFQSMLGATIYLKIKMGRIMLLLDFELPNGDE
ncbi:MAG: hypothetical protein ACI9AB_000867 [Urechidicola sp.]|jgi:hypothetical protein